MLDGKPHCPVILHKMLLYAAEQGQKEAEWMVCLGHQHSLPKLDLQVGISAVQLVGPQTSKEEFRALYYEVYKLRRLPGSPPWGMEWMVELAAEMVSSLKDHLGQKGGKPLQGIEEPGPADIQPPKSKPPRSGRRDTSAERDLAQAREAHQRPLPTMATLEEKIEELSWSITQGWPDICAHSQSQNCCRRSQGWNRRCHRVQLEKSPAHFFEYSPPHGSLLSGEDKEAKLPLLDFDLEAPPELGPEVNSFLQQLAGSSEEDNRNRSSPEPAVEEYKRWVTWRVQAHNMPGWWAFFELPWQISEQHSVENYHQAPTGTAMHLSKELPPTAWSKICLPGY